MGSGEGKANAGNNMISVILLTYNREKLVGRAIRSVLAQTFPDFELILVDNGSTDNSGAVCEEYQKADGRVRVIHTEKGNIGSGRNAGLALAQGEYIVFVDDDDWCEPDFLAFLYGMTAERAARIAICGTVREDDRGILSAPAAHETLEMTAEEAILTLLWRRHYNTGFPTKLIARELYQGLCFAQTGQYDDISLLYKLLSRADKVVYDSRPAYHVYRHGGNNSLATTSDRLITPAYLEFYRSAYRERTLWLCERYPAKSDYWWYFDWSFQISMIHKILENGLTDCGEQLESMRDELTGQRQAFLNSPHILDFEKAWMRRYVR